MFQPVKISPSILSADFMKMADEVQMMEESGADWIHVDVMDGHFVPNLTMGIPLVKQLRKSTNLPLDVHLMVENPQVQVPWFIDAGADIVTFHIEALSIQDAQSLIEYISSRGAKPAVAIKPNTPANAIEPLMEGLYMVLVMSVEPGFSGQSYIEGSEDKVAQVASVAKAIGASPLIQIDGGIGTKTAGQVAKAGADVLVCGNAVFAAVDPSQAITEIKGIADEARVASES